MEKSKICICGGGSLGTVCTGIFSSQGFKVNLLTGHPLDWQKEVVVFDPYNKEFKGKLNIISNNPSDVIPKCEIILLCVPGYLIEKTLKEIKPFLSKETIIGSIVSNTGFFFKAHKILYPGQKLFGFQRVPFISRYRKYGQSADLLGYKPLLNVAIENLDRVKSKNLFERLFITPINILNNYLEVSLSNSNPILHTGRLFALWNEYKSEVYKNPILFYEDWDDISSEIVLNLDNEFLELRDKLKISKDVIPSLLEYYEVSNTSEFTKKIKSIPAFKGLIAPMKQNENGWIPDFSSRYFTEDFPHGLKYIKELALSKGLKLKEIDKVLHWGLNKIVG